MTTLYRFTTDSRNELLGRLRLSGHSLASFCRELDLPYHHIWRVLNGKCAINQDEYELIMGKVDRVVKVREIRGLS